MCYPIRSRKSILMIQIDWVELSLLSNKTRLVLSSADDSQHERHFLSDATITAAVLDIDTCLLEFEEKHKRARCITWTQSREVNMLIFICLSLITDDAHTHIEKERERKTHAQWNVRKREGTNGEEGESEREGKFDQSELEKIMFIWFLLLFFPRIPFI